MNTLCQNLQPRLAAAAMALRRPAQSPGDVFAAWQVANVPFGDTLNVRKYPASSSQKQAAYPNGTVLQMTGSAPAASTCSTLPTSPTGSRSNWCATAGARSGTIRPRTAISSPAGSTASTSPLIEPRTLTCGAWPRCRPPFALSPAVLTRYAIG